MWPVYMTIIGGELGRAKENIASDEANDAVATLQDGTDGGGCDVPQAGFHVPGMARLRRSTRL
jgi:hypothetical protein